MNLSSINLGFMKRDFLEQRRKAKMQWLRYPNQSNVDDLNNVRREASRHFRNKRKGIY